jgi:SAM-dependent methyltransferase
VTGHWTDAYFGALYLDSVEDLLTPRLSALEADLVLRVLRLAPRDRVLDAGCGHGRHATVLAGRVGSVVGLDRSAAYLRRATDHGRVGAVPLPRYLRGDVRELPLATAAFDAAYSWYASLFMFDDRTNLACLAELCRVVRPGGRVLVHHANPLRLALSPVESARRTLPDGTIVEEESAFDPIRGVDRCARRLVRPGGATLEGTAELRYYTPSDWRALSQAAGFRLVAITSTPDAGRSPPPDLGAEAPDLIALLEKKT